MKDETNQIHPSSLILHPSSFILYLMCGIAAILLHPQERSPEMWREIKDNLSLNLLFNEERGKKATGLAVVQADGQATMQKLPVPASEFITLPEYESLLETLNAQSALILGHTRRPTKGDPSDNRNNHPLRAGPVFGIHNGHINNDDELFAVCNCPREGQVDSEVIVRLLETLPPAKLNGSYLAAVQSQLQQLQGKFTFLASDLRAPGKLLVVRHRNPLSLHYHPEWKALIFSSRYIFLRKIFGPAMLYETLPKDRLLLFEASALPQQKHRPVDTHPLHPGGRPDDPRDNFDRR